MKTIRWIMISYIFSASVQAQNDVAIQRASLVQEAMYLYRSEMAFSNGSDLFLKQTSDRSRIGGYFSYVDKETPTCIFFSGDDQPVVIGSVTFDSTCHIKTAKINLAERKFTSLEMDLYSMRNNAFEAISNDTLFRKYKDTGTDLIPLIKGNEKRMYVLTRPQKTGIIIFGNDYLLTFNEKNKVIEKNRIHRNMTTIEYQERSDSTDEIVTMHSHLTETSDLLTPTDICTLLLDEKLTNWNGHNVISTDYISVWNCEKDELLILSRATIGKIEKGKTQKRNRKKED